MQFTAQQIAHTLGGEVEGNPEAKVSTFAKIEEGAPGALSFLANPKYEHFLYSTESSVVLVQRDFKPAESVKATLVRVDNPYEAVAHLLTIYQSQTQRREGIHPLACISPTAEVDPTCYVGPFAYVGDHVKVGARSQIYAGATVEEGASLGEDCVLYPHASVYHHCRLGARVVLHSGSVVGADGFGFAPTPQGYEKIPQIGIATLEDDVEVGANACVDRSTMGSTYVRRGVKLDNLVQVAHNCDVGEHTVMSAQVGVAGSTKIGPWCMFGGQVGIAGHAQIAARTHSGAQAGIAGSIRTEGQTVQGSPAIDAKRFARASVALKFLPELQQQVRRLEQEVQRLQAELATSTPAEH